jgi:glycosyltransferase involved in cell wall biosynthesis
MTSESELEKAGRTDCFSFWPNSIEKYMRGKVTSKKYSFPIAYAGICAGEGGFFAAVQNGKKIKEAEFIKCTAKKIDQKIFSWLEKFAAKNEMKIVGCGLAVEKTSEKIDELTSDLWLKQDIVPYVFDIRSKNSEKKARSAAAEVAKRFGHDHIVDVSFDPERRVRTVRLADLHDLKRSIGRQDFLELRDLAEKFKQQEGKLYFFSSTPRGGGVAIMRHAIIRLFRLLGVDANWYVLSSKKEVFEVTKRKFHNVLQNVAPPDTRLLECDKKILSSWSEKNARKFEPIFKRAKVIVIDDYQPSGMIPLIKKVNPSVKIIYRSHIQIEAGLIKEKGTIQSKTWEYLWKNIRLADVFVSHPIKKFIPPDVQREKTVLMAPSTDKLDGLNKKLTSAQLKFYINLFNQQISGSPLDTKRPYIIQIARFDPSKGINDVVESYRKLRKKMDAAGMPKKKIPQLVIAGHGAVDDPEGDSIFASAVSLLEMDTYKDIAPDIKIAKVSDSDQVLNALLSESAVTVQLSHKEGFEFKVTEALHKGKPVVAYRTGGIPLQIDHDVTGYLVKTGNTDQVAKYLFKLLTDKKKYREMSQNAASHLKKDFFTASNAAKWLFLATELLEKGAVKGNRRLVRDIMAKKKAKSSRA